MGYNWTTEWPGVYAQHASDCPLRSGGDCTCQQIAYRATAKAPDERSRVLSPEFSSAIAARNWLRDQRARVTAATAVEGEGPSVRSVIQEFLGAIAGDQARARADTGYGQERLREATDGLGYVDAELGAKRIQMVRRRDVHALVDQLDAARLPPERINAVVGALRALFDYAIQRDLVDFNPVAGGPVQDTPAPTPQPVPAAPREATAYYNGNGNGNGNGNHAAPAYGEQTMPYTPTFTAPAAPPVTASADTSSDYWTPGVFDAYEFGDDPFSTEPPPSVPRAPWVASDPIQAEPYAGPPHPAEPDPAEPYPAEPTFAPPAASMPLATPPPAPPPPMPPAAPPHTPPPAPPHTPLPPAAPVQPFATTETRYGTPTYGTEAVSTTQAPAHEAGGSPPADNVMLSEQMFWWITRIVVIVFVLIALVLAAESV